MRSQHIALHDLADDYGWLNVSKGIIHQKALPPVLHVEISGVVVGVNLDIGIGWAQNGTASMFDFEEESLIGLISGFLIKPDPVTTVSHESSSRPMQGTPRMRTEYGVP